MEIKNKDVVEIWGFEEKAKAGRRPVRSRSTEESACRCRTLPAGFLPAEKKMKLTAKNNPLKKRFS